MGVTPYTVRGADTTANACPRPSSPPSPSPRRASPPRVESTPLPPDWFAVGFDDGDWQQARGYREEEIDPKQPYYDADFSGARFIWTDDVKLDNVVVFRHVVPAPPDGKSRPDFSNLNDVVPQGPPKGGGRRPPGGRPR
jgi:hypothetical protein